MLNDGSTRIRLAGVGLIAIGLGFAGLFIYLPIRQGPGGIAGGLSLKALVFVPLAVIGGLALTLGGAPVLEALRPGRRSRSQLALVLGIIGVSAVVTGLLYWQIRRRWLPLPGGPPVIRDLKIEVPQVTEPQWKAPGRP